MNSSYKVYKSGEKIFSSEALRGQPIELLDVLPNECGAQIMLLIVSLTNG